MPIELLGAGAVRCIERKNAYLIIEIEPQNAFILHTLLLRHHHLPQAN